MKTTNSIQVLKKIVLFFLVLIIFSKSFGQCSGFGISNLPDTVTPCKNTSFQLTPTITAAGSPSYIDTFWNTSVGLSDSNLLQPWVTVGTTSTNYIVNVQSITASNLITNGDFSLGNTIFSSSYIYGTGGTYGLLSLEGQYAIATNPNNTHINFASFGDHTTGTGNMLVVNGASSSNTAIWCQTISVNPNTWYDFSAWGATCVASNPAILQFSINSTLVGTPLALPTTTGLWTQFHAVWFSGSNTSINICINDQQIATSGNDFAIDDIAFKEICTATDSVYVNVINLTPSFSYTIKYGCDQDTVKFNAHNNPGTTASTYTWFFDDGNTSNAKNPSHIYTTQWQFNVKLITQKNGCTDSFSTVIDTRHNLIAKYITPIDPNDTVCAGTPVNILNTSVMDLGGPTADTTWNWGDGTTSFGLVTAHTYNTPGIYVATLILKDIIGCVDSVSKTFVVLTPPFVSFTASPEQVCVGQAVNFKDSITHCDQFSWDYGDGIIQYNTHNPVHSYNKSGIYNVSLTGSVTQCPNSSVATLPIIVNDYPLVNLGADTSYCSGLTGSILLANTLVANGLYVWNTGEKTNTITINTPGYYWLQVTNGGCTSTDSIWVKNDCYLNVPNSFSPNGDGVNDYFLPRDLLSSGLVSFTMNIYNRWGENIYTTSKLEGRGWDGKFNNVDQLYGVYVYSINAIFANGTHKNITGNVTLVR